MSKKVHKNRFGFFKDGANLSKDLWFVQTPCKENRLSLFSITYEKAQMKGNRCKYDENLCSNNSHGLFCCSKISIIPGWLKGNSTIWNESNRCTLQISNLKSSFKRWLFLFNLHNHFCCVWTNLSCMPKIGNRELTPAINSSCDCFKGVKWFVIHNGHPVQV